MGIMNCLLYSYKDYIYYVRFLIVFYSKKIKIFKEDMVIESYMWVIIVISI